MSSSNDMGAPSHDPGHISPSHLPEELASMIVGILHMTETTPHYETGLTGLSERVDLHM